MRRVLAIILAVFCLELACASLGYSNCGPDKDPVICDLEKSISQQERLLNSLRVKYAKLISRKKQLLDWIDQEKLKLEQKQGGPAQSKVEKKQQQPNLLPEKKTDFYKPDRDRQIDLIFEPGNKPPDKRDINYLNRLIKKQKELGAAITELEINIAAEERKLKQLKENRKLLPNSSKL
jgi:hypothetical protein